MSVREAIVARRRERILREGHALGAAVAAARAVPLVPFGVPPMLVAEVKRRSPSRGDIAPGMDAVAQARLYAERGARSVSVLTEQDSFGGSLDDLIAVKRALPGISVLRKDFLLDVEDVEVSWRAGADAVLLIAGMLEPAALAAMHRRATGLGMAALVEVHDPAEVDAVRPLAPPLVGVNCRDLVTFAVDRLHPLSLRPRITWPARMLWESGIRGPADVAVARAGGYDGVLVGETAVRSPGLIPAILSALQGPPTAVSPAGASFWPRLAARRRQGRPLVKVCGIARAADAGLAASLGADVLGFVFADSPRRADPGLLREVRDLPVLKVAVTVSDRSTGAMRLDPVAADLAGEGLVDAVQMHGEETPAECEPLPFPWYKAVRLRAAADVESMTAWGCPRVLVDAYSAAAAGGTGRRADPALARAAGLRGPLWLAGGIGPANVGEVLRGLAPELVDASSGLEEAPGRKDPAKLRTFFEEISRHGTP